MLDQITLEEQTRRSLTEYEEHRLVENIRSGKQILAVEARFDFSDFDQRLRALSAKLSESGEVISTLPAVDASGAVEATVFAARVGGGGGFGVPTFAVRKALANAKGPVSTGPCAP